MTFEDRRYLPSDKADFTAGEKLGTATIAACDDTPGDSGGSVLEDTTTAYAVGDTPAGARLVEIR